MMGMAADLETAADDPSRLSRLLDVVEDYVSGLDDGCESPRVHICLAVGTGNTPSSSSECQRRVGAAGWSLRCIVCRPHRLRPSIKGEGRPDRS